MTARISTALAATCLILGSLGAQADAPPPQKPEAGALEAALKACDASVARDANGRPERAAMHACMQAKGFPPPPHHHGREDGGKPPPPPPQQ